MSLLTRFLRTILFDICFIGFSALVCITTAPACLFPKPVTMIIVRFYARGVYFIERTVLGLDYEVRGLENLPAQGPYIVAAKHQSTYETLKLHILFDDPAIILKRELLRIPLWGWFLSKIDPIAIDRSNRESAMSSIITGAQRMKDQNRAIIIFPQGTRVRPHATPEQKPYKGGIVKMYAATNLPIIPLALNSGVYWPRHGFLKRPGIVVLEFLPAIEPGLPDKKVMQALEQRLETASNALTAEALKAV